MEVKLSHSHSHRRAVLPVPDQASTFPSHCFSFKQQFRGLLKKWRIQLQEVAAGQNSSTNLVVRVVKEGETLTSILRRHGVSVCSTTAVNKNILDVGLVSEGQKLNIPSRNEIQVTRKNGLSSFDLKHSHQQFLDIFDGVWNKMICTVNITHSLPHAKTTGYFLVLVPLLAFCIRCMIGAFRTRIAGASRCQGVKESKGNPRGFKNVRWRSALSDIIEGDVSGSDSRPQKDVLDSNARPDSDDPSEYQSQVSFEEFSHAYSKLEVDYEKFLSECGISKWGYWRGGSPK